MLCDNWLRWLATSASAGTTTAGRTGGTPRIASSYRSIARGAAIIRRTGRPGSTGKAEGSSSVGRAAVSKTAGRGFESLLPCSCRTESGEKIDGQQARFCRQGRSQKGTTEETGLPGRSAAVRPGGAGRAQAGQLARPGPAEAEHGCRPDHRADANRLRLRLGLRVPEPGAFDLFAVTGSVSFEEVVRSQHILGAREQGPHHHGASNRVPRSG